MATALKHKQRSSHKYQQEQRSLASNVSNMVRTATTQKVLKEAQMTFGQKMSSYFVERKGINNGKYSS